MAKPISALSPAYRKRLENYARKHGVTVEQARTAARGHAKTPEHPERAIKNPTKYQDYTRRLNAQIQAVQQKKQRVFPLPGSKKHYSAKRSNSAVTSNPQPGTGGKVNRQYLARFLRMTDTEILDIDWSDAEWGFLFYH